MCYVCVRTNTLISSFFSSHFSARGGSWEIAACSTTATYFLFGEEGEGDGTRKREMISSEEDSASQCTVYAPTGCDA